MTRSIVIVLVSSIAVAVVSGTGCAQTGVGDPCTPEQEFDPTFASFDFHEVSTESKSFQCLTRVCLVNHFQGRVSCPYGQAADGTAISPAQPECNVNNPFSNKPAGCCTPGIPQAVTGPLTAPLNAGGMPADSTNQQLVPGQCTNRTADQAVYCSCRCANINGGTDDGAVYCSCPDGFTCTQLITSIENGQNEGLTGAYCVKNNTAFDPNVGCASNCSPATGMCGKAQGINM